MTEPNMAASAQSGREYSVEHPVDPRLILGEQLAQSNEVLRECWRAQRDPNLEMRLQLDIVKLAARLMKINLKQAQALDPRPREFVHRIVVERAGERAVHAEGSAELPPSPHPPAKILKTIPGGTPPTRHNYWHTP